MPVTYSAKESKRLGAAIIKFLQHHKDNKRLAPDQEEGLGVAMQCLTLVFDAVPGDAKDLPELMKTYNEAAGDLGIVADVAITEEQIKLAEEAKSKGNDAMKAKEYQKGVEHYTEAIKNNGTQEMYFCNRAAAYTNLEKYHEALDDCKKAISINENYAKAFSRMALIYSKLQFFEESVACYKTAIELEPENESYKQNLGKVQVKADQLRKEQMANMTPEQVAMMGMQQGVGAAGGPLPGGEMPPGMMEAYAQFAQNPEFGQMAETVMNNPEMKGMIDSFMQNSGVTPPSAGGEIPADPMAALGSAMGSGANVNQLMELGQQFAAHMQKENPELIENLRSQMQGLQGASAPKDGEEKKE